MAIGRHQCRTPIERVPAGVPLRQIVEGFSSRVSGGSAATIATVGFFFLFTHSMIKSLKELLVTLKREGNCDTKFFHRDFVLKYVVIGGKKGLTESGLFLGPILEQIGTCCRYLHQNAELFKNEKNMTTPSRAVKKLTETIKSLSSKYTHILICSPRTIFTFH